MAVTPALLLAGTTKAVKMLHPKSPPLTTTSKQAQPLAPPPRRPHSAASSFLKRDTLLWSIIILAITLASTQAPAVWQRLPGADPFPTSNRWAFQSSPPRQILAASPSHPSPSFPEARLRQSCSCASISSRFPALAALAVVGVASITACLLAPAWYLLGGRQQLLAAACLLPKAAATVHLIVQTAPLDPLQQQLGWSCFVGMQGAVLAMLWHALFRVSDPSW
jgi:hypothetical protein